MGNQNATNGDGTDVDEFVPARYSVINWPMGLQIDRLHVVLEQNLAVATINDETVKPYIPLDQLGRFLNDHVQGSVKNLIFSGGAGGLEDGLPRLLDEVTVPARLHSGMLSFTDFFHLPSAGIERILDGRTLRAKTIISFDRLQLSSRVDPNGLFKLATVRECPVLHLYPSLPQLPGPPPLFDNAALMEWLEQGEVRLLFLASDYLSDGLLSFLHALKENFQQATQVHLNIVEIRCPSINGVTGGLGVQDEELFNRLGEKMEIKVGANPTATEAIEHPFEALQVTRVLLP